MRSKLIHEPGGERTFALAFQSGDEAMAGLSRFCKEHGICAARITAIGALNGATLGYFDWEKKDYRKVPVDEQVELLSLIGDVALEGSEPTRLPSGVDSKTPRCGRPTVLGIADRCT